MTLTSGSTLASYEILDRLGAGAMGEVYRARDARLHREVAIKVLPEHLAESPERLARFEREARSLASLNHPGIAQIYGVDEEGETHFLVLELVPGESLEDRLARGPLPMDEAIETCRQIAEGLEAAHEAGVVHRDLKPANVRLTPEGRAKLLDFGLAKPNPGPTGVSGSGDDGETLSLGAVDTADGQLLGTPSYMAPEQARGRPVDRRADVWAFGCLLYECLAGRRPFVGESVPDVLSAVLSREPDWTRLPEATPPAVRRLVERCLTKDAYHRLRDVGDARLELSQTLDSEPPSSAEARTGAADAPRSASPWALLGAFAAGAALLAAAWVLFGSADPPPSPVTRFSLTGTGMQIDAFQALALSPDGSRLVFRARGDDGVERLYVRSMNDVELQPLEGTEGTWMPFFSPDGERVGAFSSSSLVTVGFDGAPPREIARVDRSFGGAWLADGSIVFDVATGLRLRRVPATGGDVEILDLEVEGERVPGALASPSPLPGGEAVLAQVRLAETYGDSFDVAVVDLAERSIEVIAENGFSPTWVDTGHVVYQQGQDGPLLALPFDPKRREVTGPAFAVLSDLGSRISIQVRMFAVAGNGTLAYLPNSAVLDHGALVWVDRQGRAEPIVEIGKVVDSPRLSPDGRRIAFRTPAPNCDVWVHDLERSVTTRVTKEGDNHGLAWTPDGRAIAISRNLSGGWAPLAARADGSGDPEPLGPTVPNSWTTSYSPDGRLLLVDGQTEERSAGIFLVSLETGTSEPLIDTPFSETSGVFSPDGRRVAYVSDESGTDEVYVQRFPQLDERIQVSTGGGAEPVWARDGGSLFFRSDRRVLQVDFPEEEPLALTRPRLLFEGAYASGRAIGPPGFDVSPDGDRFVMVRERSETGGAEINVVLHWLDEVRALDPENR